MAQPKYARLIHSTFQVGIILKGVDGLFELIGGILLLIVRPETISYFVLLLTEHELSREPKDIIANYLLSSSQHLTGGTQLFGSIYLLSHGVIKFMLVLSLWKKKLWAYPAAIIFFVLFIVYQMYRFSYSSSIWLVVLSVLDALIVMLTWKEYRRIREKIGG